MAYDLRTGIQSFAQADPSADVNAAIDVPEAVAPSTATSLLPPKDPAAVAAWKASLKTMFPITSNAEFGTEIIGYHPSDYNPYGYLGEDLIRGPLDQIAGAAGADGVDWLPYLDQYWMDEWQDQIAHGRRPTDIFSHRQGFGDTLLGVSDLAGFGDLAAQNVGPGTDFYEQYNTLPNWVESRRDEKRDAGFYSTAAFLLGGLLAPGISEWAGGGLGGGIAAGAVQGGLSGLAAGDPIGGAVRGGLSAGVQNVAAPAIADAAGGMLDRMGFSSDALFGGVGLDDAKRAGAATALYSQPAQTTEPLFGGGSFSQPAMTTMQEPGALLTSGMLPATVATQNLFPGATGSVDAPRPEVEVEEPSLIDKAGRYLKLGKALASLGGGGEGAPQDAPQREEGQSDADFAQSLAAYVNVDAGALAEMGLTPGTPQYYEYLMGQMDNTLAGYEDAADLMGQLRGKTQDELTNLRRALYVRGQLDQLMGSGTYTDPFTGLGEEVIDAGGAGINPGMAAYQRGFGRSIEGFAGLDPTARREEIGSFLDRAPDLYGVQGRMDARSEQEAMVQAFLEDLKRRQGGMLRGAPQFWE
jgi:hypothetical protein